MTFRVCDEQFAWNLKIWSERLYATPRSLENASTFPYNILRVWNPRNCSLVHVSVRRSIINFNIDKTDSSTNLFFLGRLFPSRSPCVACRHVGHYIGGLIPHWCGYATPSYGAATLKTWVKFEEASLTIYMSHFIFTLLKQPSKFRKVFAHLQKWTPISSNSPSRTFTTALFWSPGDPPHTSFLS